MKARRIFQTAVLVAAATVFQTHLAQAQVRSGSSGPAATPPAGPPPAVVPPTGVPPAVTPPAVVPPAGVPPAGTPPAGGGIVNPQLGQPPTVNSPNMVPGTLTNGNLNPRFGRNGFPRWRRGDGDGDADDRFWRGRRFGTNGPYLRRPGTNGISGSGINGVYGTNGLPSVPQGQVIPR